jgi:hypothetical protein
MFRSAATDSGVRGSEYAARARKLQLRLGSLLGQRCPGSEIRDHCHEVEPALEGEGVRVTLALDGAGDHLSRVQPEVQHELLARCEGEPAATTRFTVRQWSAYPHKGHQLNTRYTSSNEHSLACSLSRHPPLT